MIYLIARLHIYIYIYIMVKHDVTPGFYDVTPDISLYQKIYI